MCAHTSYRNLRGADDRIVICDSCNLIFLAPRLRITELAEYYTNAKVWRDWANDPVLSQISHENARLRLRLIRQFTPSGTLLDIGTHDGAFIEEARQMGFDAMGIEPNKKAVEEATKRHIPVYEETVETFTTDRYFNVVTMFHVLEHCADPGASLMNMRKLCAPQGIAVIEVPNIESYLAIHHGASWKYIAREHVWYFSLITLSALLDKTGFEIIFSKKINGEIPYLSFSDMIQYVCPSPYFKRDRFKMKSSSSSALVPIPHYRGLRKLLSYGIHAIGRADHLFILARPRAAVRIPKIPD